MTIKDELIRIRDSIDALLKEISKEALETELNPEDKIFWADWSVRTSNVLCRNGVDTWQKLATYRPDDILRIKNLGKTSLREIRFRLALRSMALVGDDPKQWGRNDLLSE